MLWIYDNQIEWYLKISNMVSLIAWTDIVFSASVCLWILHYYIAAVISKSLISLPASSWDDAEHLLLKIQSCIKIRKRRDQIKTSLLKQVHTDQMQVTSYPEYYIVVTSQHFYFINKWFLGEFPCTYKPQANKQKVYWQLFIIYLSHNPYSCILSFTFALSLWCYLYTASMKPNTIKHSCCCACNLLRAWTKMENVLSYILCIVDTLRTGQNGWHFAGTQYTLQIIGKKNRQVSSYCNSSKYISDPSLTSGKPLPRNVNQEPWLEIGLE